ncbi:hypothetical protein BHM03_00059360 [Ensete ventricosum]|nr:hypothetical protein BHM03_00059360 [Ensete ventricosum]
MRGQSLEFPELFRVLRELCTRGQPSKFSKFIGVGSSFPPKDALTPLSSSASSSSLLPLRWLRLPLPVGNRPAKGRPPLRLAPPPLPARLAVGSSPCERPTASPLCERHAASSCHPCGLAAVGRALGRHFCPPASPLRATAPCGRYCPDHGWPTLHRGWPWLAAPPSHCLRCENATRTYSTILRDTISSHIV